MGQAAPSLDISITKGTSGVIAFTETRDADRGRTGKIYPCIRCGYCLDACPMFLDPCSLGLLAATTKNTTAWPSRLPPDGLLRVRQRAAFVCPAHIPLVQQVPRGQGGGAPGRVDAQGGGGGMKPAGTRPSRSAASPHIVSGQQRRHASCSTWCWRLLPTCRCSAVLRLRPGRPPHPGAWPPRWARAC